MHGWHVFKQSKNFFIASANFFRAGGRSYSKIPRQRVLFPQMSLHDQVIFRSCFYARQARYPLQITLCYATIFISVIEPNTVENNDKKEEIINSINLENKEYFDIVNIVEGEFDYTIEIKKSQLSIDKNISSLEIINIIKPDFDAIEKITLSNGKICII